MNHKIICMITSQHSPFDPRIFYREALSLKRNGYLPIIISGNGYFNEMFYGIRICGFRRGWFSNFLTRVMLIDCISILRLFLIAIKIKSQVYHAHELESLIAACMCKLFKKYFKEPIKVIYDVHEWYPELSNYGIRDLLRYKLLRAYDKFFSRYADLVIATEVEKGERYATYRGKKDVLILGHYPPLNIFSFNSFQKTEEGRPFVLGYVGGLTLDRGALTMLKVVNYMKEKGVQNISVLYVGNFSLLKQRDIVLHFAKNKSIDLEITGWKSFEEVPKQIARMDLCLALLHPKPYYMNAIPIKLFEYMACGKPILASDFKNIKNILNESKAGIVIDPLNIERIADTILQLISNKDKRMKMSFSGLRYIQKGHHWGVLEKLLLKKYEDLCRTNVDRNEAELE
jgi:glycosyltransferase involved in cell wall biosynthesis